MKQFPSNLFFTPEPHCSTFVQRILEELYHLEYDHIYLSLFVLLLKTLAFYDLIDQILMKQLIQSQCS